MRLHWIDWIKCICILTMVAAHMWMPRSLAILIYTFHMPLLFMVSGYLYKDHSLMDTIKSLWIPVALISCVMLILQIADWWISGGGIYDYIRNVTWLDYRDDSGSGLFTGVWFIEALFICRVILHFFKRYYLYIGLGCLTLMSLFPLLKSEVWHYYPMRFFSCFPFVSLGIWLKERNWTPTSITRKGFVIGLFIFLWAWLIDGQHSLRCNTFGWSYISFFISSVAASVVLAKVCTLLPENGFVRIISVGTLFILGTHMQMIGKLIPYLPGRLWNVSYMIIPMMIAFIDYFLIKICLRYCPVLLGKVKR